jgi:lycopene cyclase domain-containing protein
MEVQKFTYLIILVAAIAVPLMYSFEKQVRFYTKMKYLLPAIIFTAAVFIIWDLRFEELGIWKFNIRFITGVYILNLPVEEWLFFFVIPYCCMFIYEIIKVKFSNIEFPNFFLAISLVLLILFIAVAYFAREKLYTFFTFFLLSIYFGYTIFRNRFKKHFTKFYMTYFISLVPFIITNYLLTSLAVVEYNDLHNLGLRFITIPVEDFFYFFLMLLMNVSIYEYTVSHFSHK